MELWWLHLPGKQVRKNPQLRTIRNVLDPSSLGSDRDFLTEALTLIQNLYILLYFLMNA